MGTPQNDTGDPRGSEVKIVITEEDIRRLADGKAVEFELETPVEIEWGFITHVGIGDAVREPEDLEEESEDE